MSRNYYIFSNGRVRRENNTVYIENAEGVKKPLPVEDIDSLYLYGEIDLNTRLLNFLGQRKIPLHVFNYYGNYSGSYYPREYLHSGFLLVRQVTHYTDNAKRLALAREFVHAAAHSLVRNLSYYERRKPGPEGADEPDRDPSGEIGDAATAGYPADETAEAAIDAGLVAPLLNDTADDPALDPITPTIDFDTGLILTGPDAGTYLDDPAPKTPPTLAQIRAGIERTAATIPAQTDVNTLRGVEGSIRVAYYRAWKQILAGNTQWDFDRRVRRPPDNEINALISFGNGILYTVCLSEIYRTQLTPTISYLHEPGARRFSLALDISEIFKPLIVDRAIFRLLNTGQLKPAHFDKTLNACYLTDAGKKLYTLTLQERLESTIKHRRLGRSVSYRHLIRLECYKLIRHLTGVETYRAFRAWW
jgi:CRISPR/Cas system-associated endonuclease Cas1